MENQLEKHYTNRSSWLRAAVLGANDGILSTASIAVGVAAASNDRNTLILAAVAGIVAGALSMAAGEYVSVSSQADIEEADLAREAKELETIPEIELQELAKIYVKRGLKKETAQIVAQQLTEHNALEAHARDELGINEITQAQPLQAAIASGIFFILGGLQPVIVSIFAPMSKMIISQYLFTLFFLIILGAFSAKIGGAPIKKAIFRITFWGTFAMGLTALVGSLFNI